MQPIRVLLAECIDYAGLFPPAGLEMQPSVSNYAAYAASQYDWALGRFVVPAARLEEFAAALLAVELAADTTWRVSALVGDAHERDLTAVAAFNSRHAPRVLVDSLELKATTPAQIAALEIPQHYAAYVEIPAADPAPLVAVIAERGLRAKLRTGGLVADAFPAQAQLLAFLRACEDADVAFKATAGLHHAQCGSYRLTYDPESMSAPMFGFLNVLLATAALHAGWHDADAAALLAHADLITLGWDASGVTCPGGRLDVSDLAAARKKRMIAFGSCSFAEPVTELEELGLL